jgi:hypothetical protein
MLTISALPLLIQGNIICTKFVSLKEHQTIKAMARPIKDTPDLKGKDARRFFDKMDNVQKVSPEELARIKKSASKFVFVLD